MKRFGLFLTIFMFLGVVSLTSCNQEAAEEEENMEAVEPADDEMGEE
jgi:hypothetical protein